MFGDYKKDEYNTELFNQAVKSLTYPCVECKAFDRMTEKCRPKVRVECYYVTDFCETMARKFNSMTPTEVKRFKRNNRKDVKDKVKKIIKEESEYNEYIRIYGDDD